MSQINSIISIFTLKRTVLAFFSGIKSIRLILSDFSQIDIDNMYEALQDKLTVMCVVYDNFEFEYREQIEINRPLLKSRCV